MKPAGLLYFAPAVGYMALIFGLSSRPAPAVVHGWPVVLGMKLVHLIEYALLAALWLDGFLRGTRLRFFDAACWTVLIAFAWGILDELHQAFVPGRSPAVTDAYADLVAALLTVLLVGAWRRRRVLKSRP